LTSSPTQIIPLTNSPMKTPALFTLLFLSIASAGVASTINFDTGTGNGHMFVTSTGDRLAAGSLVRLGTLGTDGDLSTFAEFGRTTISHPGAADTLQVGGFLTIPVANGDTAANEAAAGKKVYLWVYATPEESSQSGVFTSSDPTWVVPQTFTGDADQAHNLFLANDGVTGETAPGGLPGASWARGA